MISRISNRLSRTESESNNGRPVSANKGVRSKDSGLGEKMMTDTKTHVLPLSSLRCPKNFDFDSRKKKQ